jgi:AcrR family transcriptional regulator
MTGVAEILPGRREKRKQEIRQRIERAAYTLFKRKGIEATSIEQICMGADVARRTFYGHYPNKYALLQSLSRTRVWGTVDALLQEIMENHESTSHRLSAMINTMEQNISSYEAVDRALILLTPASSEDQNHLRDVSDTLKEQLKHIFEIGQDSGDTTDSYSADLLAEMVVGTTNTLLMSWAVDTDYPIIDKLEEARLLFNQVICIDS